MTYGAIDLHSKQTQVRIVTDTGDTLDRRIRATRSSSRGCSAPRAPHARVGRSLDRKRVGRAVPRGGGP